MKRITIITVVLTAIASLAISLPAIASLDVVTTKPSVDLTCTWDNNNDGIRDAKIIANIPPQRSSNINWKMRCHRARMIVDHTYTQADLWSPDTEATPVVHWWGQWFDDNQDGQSNDAYIKVELPNQGTWFCDARCFWQARKQLDDGFVKSYPIP